MVSPTGGARDDTPFPFGRTVHVVTAANPDGRSLSLSENWHRHEQLTAECHRRGLEVLPAVGETQAGRHADMSLALVGATREEALDLGRMFSQDAVFEWTPEALRVLACDGRVAHEGAFRCTTPPEPAARRSA